MKAEVSTVKTDDFTMDYCRFGKGAKALVMIPGLSIVNVLNSANSIAAAYDVLTEDYTFYVMERRNNLPDQYTVEDTAKDTVKAVSALGLEYFSLCGASYGGMVSMYIAASWPEKVEKAVVASTAANVTEEPYKVVGSWVELAQKGDPLTLYMAFGEALYPKDVYEASKPLIKELAAGVTEEDLRRFTVLAKGMKGFNLIDSLDKIKCPLFVVGDKQDKVLGADASMEIEKAMQGKPGFEMYMYDGFGHAVFDLAPDFKERVLAFFKK